MNDILAILGVLIGFFSLVYAILANQEKAKLEKVIKIRLENVIESTEDVVNNAALAHTHIDATRQFLNGLEHSEGMNVILDRIAWAEADVTAAHRMSKRLKRDVETLRNGLYFKDSNRQHNKTKKRHPAQSPGSNGRPLRSRR